MTYCFTGYPLSGKTTLSRRLAGVLRTVHFSSGEYARSLGMKMEPSIRELDLSVEHDRQITEAAMQMAVQGAVLDGFPRSLEQVEALRAARVDFKVIFVIENPVEVFERINERARKEGRPEDAADVVASRLRRSMAFKRELESALDVGEMLVFQASQGFDVLIDELVVGL